MHILMPKDNKLSISGIFSRPASFIKRNTLIVALFTTHTLFAVFLGRLFALAPDEGGYLYTFNNIYKWPITPWAQSGSGWISAPTIFLWIAYLPAKILNMLGVADYLSIRILSIILVTLSLYLLKNILDHIHLKIKFPHKAIFIVFFIPSVFLWTSVGLRESFIIAELTVFLVGLNFLMNGKNKRAYAFIFLGSYGLISTKNYLWACLIVTVILSSVIFLLQGNSWRKILSLFTFSLFIPIIVFSSTTSAYALNFMLHPNISSTGERSGDSISQVYVDTSGTGTGTGTGTFSPSTCACSYFEIQCVFSIVIAAYNVNRYVVPSLKISQTRESAIQLSFIEIFFLESCFGSFIYFRIIVVSSNCNECRFNGHLRHVHIHLGNNGRNPV